MTEQAFEDELPWPGPFWEPVIHDGIFPLIADVGDLYVNRHVEPPLIYIFTTKSNTEPVSAEEVHSWVAGGLMKAPTPVQPSSRQLSKPMPTLPSATQ